MDEVFLKVTGVTHYLWPAVHQNGVTIDILVQPKRDRIAAMRFSRKLLQANGRSRPRAPAPSVPEQPGGELLSADA